MGRAKLLVSAVGFLLGPLVLASIWVPVVGHYYVPTIALSDELVARSRSRPTDDVLADLSSIAFLMPLQPESQAELQRLADDVLGGVLSLPGYDPIRISVPFDDDDLATAPSNLQLSLARLVVPEILLKAYEATHNEAYFSAATDTLVAFAEYERRSLLPKGSQWNDHAVAASVQVLAEFWRIYRHHPTFRTDVARLVISLADRSGRLLAKPAQFTVAGNHGVMQNLALLNLALAFPELPEAKSYADLALHRLTLQMRFLVSTEGVVLEHSFGYHATGTNLLGAILEYVERLGLDAPQDWRDKFDAAVRFDTLVRRADGSLPKVGDTTGTEKLERAALSLPPFEPVNGPLSATYPISGYGILWGPESRDGSYGQAAMTWSNFEGHAHKHADELSVTLWAAGRDWWSNIGYWPYDSALRNDAASWQGSSAPHLRGEAAADIRVGDVASTPRASRLLAEAHTDELAALDVQRDTTFGYSVRRQLVRVGADLWIVADQHTGTGSSGSRAVFTAAPDLTVRDAGVKDCHVLESVGRTASMLSCFAASPGTEIRALKGSLDPFAGWQLTGNQSIPSSAFVVDGSGDAPWSVAVWLLDESGALSASVPRVITAWDGPEHWTVTVDGGTQSRTVVRNAAAITVSTTDGTRADTLTLEPVANPHEPLAIVRAAFLEAQREYPAFRNALVSYRYRATLVLFAGWLIQEAILAGLLAIRRSFVLPLRLASAAAWVVGGFWLHFSYFVA